MAEPLTQCPHCLTVFRVTAEQLEIADGLVRCGACRQVFAATEHWVNEVEASPQDGRAGTEISEAYIKELLGGESPAPPYHALDRRAEDSPTGQHSVDTDLYWHTVPAMPGEELRTDNESTPGGAGTGAGGATGHALAGAILTPEVGNGPYSTQLRQDFAAMVGLSDQDQAHELPPVWSGEALQRQVAAPDSDPGTDKSDTADLSINIRVPVDAETGLSLIQFDTRADTKDIRTGQHNPELPSTEQIPATEESTSISATRPGPADQDDPDDASFTAHDDSLDRQLDAALEAAAEHIETSMASILDTDEAKAVPETETEATTGTEIDTETAGAIPAAAVDVDPAGSDIETDVNADEETAAEAGIDLDAETIRDAGVDKELDTVVAAESHPEMALNADTEAPADTDAELNPGSDSVAIADTEAAADINASADTGTNTGETVALLPIAVADTADRDQKKAVLDPDWLTPIEPPPIELFSDSAHKRSPRELLGIACGGLLGLLLVLQYIWFERSDLATDRSWRGQFEFACRLLGCSLPAYSDLARIRGNKLLVVESVDRDGVLLAEAQLTNLAEYAQSFPVVELSFSDIDGELLARRGFYANEYLASDWFPGRLMQAGESARFSVALVDPGNDAVNYRLRLRAARNGE